MKAYQVITSSVDVLGGTLVFAGTRVPIKNLMDYLKTGHTIDDFLEDFPSVTRDQVTAIIDLARDQLTEAFDAHFAACPLRFTFHVLLQRHQMVITSACPAVIFTVPVSRNS